MAHRAICFGDMQLHMRTLELFGSFRKLERFDKHVLNNKSLTGKKLLVDADELRLTTKQIVWIMTKAKANLLLITKRSALSKRAWHKNTTIYKGDDWESKSFWDCVNAVLFDKDRDAVLKLLEETRPPIFPLWKFIVSNINLDNIEELAKIDELVLDVKAQYLYSIIAFGLKPFTRKFWTRYRFPKKELKKNASQEVPSKEVQFSRWAQENIDPGKGVRRKKGSSKSSVSRKTGSRKKPDSGTNRTKSLC